MMQVMTAFRRGLAPASTSLSGSFGSNSLGFNSMALRAFATKLKRDPARPKIPMTPFFSYLGTFRKSEAAKALKAKEVVTVAAQKWKTLSPAEKAPIDKAYAERKATYDAAFKQYKDSGKLDAWKRDPAKPKRPLTGFMRFAAEYRDKNAQTVKSMKVTDVTKNIGAEWKRLSPDQKAKYNDEYKRAKTTFDKDMKAYKDSGKELAFKKKTGLLAIEEAAAKKKQQAKEKLLREKKRARAKLLKNKKALSKKKLEARKKLLTKKKLGAQKVAKAKATKKMTELKKQQLKAKDALKKIESAKKQLMKTMKKSVKATAGRKK